LRCNRLGGGETVKVDVRLIAATNRDLRAEVKGGAFRSDLFYRLNVFAIHLPPLRERPDDIPLLVAHFTSKHGDRLGRRITRIERGALKMLQSYHWPGNVRELENVIERAVIMSSNDFFAYGARSMARAMTRTGQSAYLYYFTYAERGKRAYLGAYHGEELKFLSDSFPSDWEHNSDDEKLGEAMRTYWTQFAKTGNPNTQGFPVWPAYDVRSDQCFELGYPTGVRPVGMRLQALEQIMEQVFAETANVQLQSKSN
jgi:Carboxylesterase family/Sigma-54 interaction domain